MESEIEPTGKDRRDMTITNLQEEIHEKHEEIEDLNGIIKKIVGVIPQTVYEQGKNTHISVCGNYKKRRDT